MDILCASDLTPAATTALYFALRIAQRTNGSVALLHVLEHEEDGAREKAQTALMGQVAALGSTDVDVILAKGEPLAQIVKECGNGHGLVVLGTHGLKGLRQKLFGADMLKLIRKAGIPSLVVQEGTRKTDALGPIVMPVAAHEDIHRLLEIVATIAHAYAAEVHVYQLMRPGEDVSDELLNNKRMMLDQLDGQGIRVKEVNEPGTGPSISFAGPTLEYAERIGAGSIAIMCHASKEFSYMADAEKERMLTNSAQIPILCA